MREHSAFQKIDPEVRFSFPRYAADHWLQVLIALFAVVGVALSASTLGVGWQATLALAGLVAVAFAAVGLTDFARRRRFWRQAASLIARAQQPSDLFALLDEPDFLEGRIAFRAAEQLVALANRDASANRRDSEQYRRYIELWIHETKTPIAAAKLAAQRLGGEDGHTMARELERIERQVEQALYYARSTAVANDYEIREVNLAAACAEACKRNGRFLIEQGATPAIEVDPALTVLADEPWLLFMLGQVVVNAAQYHARTIRFTASVQAEGTPHGHTLLEVADDGDGIAAADLPRVFDRGFTGANGRARGTATGMGLFLVANMCAALGLGVSLTSEEGAGTIVAFDFPHDRRQIS